MGRINQKKNPLLFATIGNYKKFARQQHQNLKESSRFYADMINYAYNHDIPFSINWVSKKFYHKSVACVNDALSSESYSEYMRIITNSLFDGLYYMCYKNIEYLCLVDSGDYKAALCIDSHILLHLHRDQIYRASTGSVDFNFNEGICSIIAIFLASLWYKQHAGIEIKKVPGNTRTKLFNCAYKNECKLPIDILDTNWYTTIIRVKPFLRREHYRNVRYGKGRNKSKLVWIPSTLVNGYTRTARKEKKSKGGEGLTKFLSP